MKINVGCGHHHPEGFINIDINPDVKPDLICDVSKLPYLDNSVEFILASHVIEHFQIWKAGDVLKEWYRILQSTGVLHIECPDLSKVFRNYLERPDEPLLSMGGLYGDYTLKEEYQVHYWCYTYPELKRMLLDVGFKTVQEVPFLGHKTPRDMALVGIK